jgi:hypothetical protein
MKEKEDTRHLQGKPAGEGNKNEFPGYPAYPAGDDIFNKYQEEKDVNPEDISKIKDLNEIASATNREDFTIELSGSDLDVPGSELDDEMEEIGSEDEENNYYSLGGDNHTDLDENKD